MRDNLRVEKESRRQDKRSLQFASFAIVILVLWIVVLPRLLKTIDEAFTADAESKIVLLTKAEKIYYSTYGVYTDDIDELDFVMPHLKDALGESKDSSRWNYVITVSGNDCYITIRRKRFGWFRPGDNILSAQIGK